MPANTAPNAYLPGIRKFTSDSGGAAASGTFGNSKDYFAIPLSAVPECVFADVDPSTGDIRDLVYGLQVALYTAYAALATADKPTKWVPSLSTNIQASGQIIRIYANRFETTVTGEDVSSE
jgi:hypothetical protein